MFDGSFDRVVDVAHSSSSLLLLMLLINVEPLAEVLVVVAVLVVGPSSDTVNDDFGASTAQSRPRPRNCAAMMTVGVVVEEGVVTSSGVG